MESIYNDLIVLQSCINNSFDISFSVASYMEGPSTFHKYLFNTYIKYIYNHLILILLTG